MTRLLIWLTLIALVFAGSDLITAMDKINSQTPYHTAPGGANTGQPQPPVADHTVDPAPIKNAKEHDIVAVQDLKNAGATFEQRCEEQLLPSTVTAVVQDAVVVRDFSKNITTLTVMAENTKTLTLGLTVSQPQLKIVWNISYLQEGEAGRVCMRPQFYIAVSTGTQNVYVGKEFVPGTCAFNEILQHELMHVETNKKITELVANNVKKHISDSIENRVFYGKSKAEVEGFVVDAVENHWLPLVKTQFEYYKKFHHAIDTREEYLRIHNSCSGEIPAILSQRSAGAQ